MGVMNKRRNILAVLAMVLIMGPTSNAVAEVMPWVEFKPIAPVTVDVEDIDFFALITPGAPGQVIFEFHNESQIQSAIPSIYFEDYGLDGVADIQTPDNIFFEEEITPANFPGGANLDPAFYTAFSIGADPSPVSNGINPGEQLNVTVDLHFGSVNLAPCHDLLISFVRNVKKMLLYLKVSIGFQKEPVG